MYLYASLVTGDVNPERSDIDFVVVTAVEVSRCDRTQSRELCGSWHSTHGLRLPRTRQNRLL